jgi:hypothetical protein
MKEQHCLTDETVGEDLKLMMHFTSACHENDFGKATSSLVKLIEAEDTCSFLPESLLSLLRISLVNEASCSADRVFCLSILLFIIEREGKKFQWTKKILFRHFPSLKPTGFDEGVFIYNLSALAEILGITTEFLKKHADKLNITLYSNETVPVGINVH